jgi:hypothetical protein
VFYTKKLSIAHLVQRQMGRGLVTVELERIKSSNLSAVPGRT